MLPVSLQRRLLTHVIFVALMCTQGVTRASSIPINTSGELSTTYRERTFNGGDDSASDWLSIASINASSYIWQPWFALVSGNLSLSTNEQNGSNQASRSSDYIGGNISFNLFPSSRFPFQLYASKSQNTLNDAFTEQTIDNTLIRVKQRYDSFNGRQSYSGGIEQSTRVDFDQSRFITDRIDFLARIQLDNHTLNSTIDYSNATFPDEKDSTNYSLSGRHSYTGQSNLSWGNSISSTQSDADFSTSRTESFNDQISSFLSWRPEANADITVTGNLLLSELEQSFNRKDPSTLTVNDVTQSSQAVISLNQGLSYNYSPRINISESLNATQSGLSENEVVNISGSAGIRYSSESFLTTAGLYDWNLSSNINLRRSNDATYERSLDNQAGHSLSKSFTLNPALNLQSSLNQSLGFSTSSEGTNSRSLSHSLGLNLAHSDFNKNSSLNLTLSDSRSDGASKNSFQLFNLQLSNDYRLNRNASFASNITYQMSRVTTDGILTLSKNINGQISYIQTRFYDIPELSFKSRINFSKQIPEVGNELVADNSTASENGIENELVYRIGLFEAKATLDFIKSANSYNQIFMLQLTRTF